MDDHSSESEKLSNKSKFRLRILPVGFLLAMGSIVFVISMFGIFQMAFTTWTGMPLYVGGPVGFQKYQTLASVWFINTGGLLVIAGLLLEKGNWKSALVIVALVLLAGVILENTVFDLGR